MGGGQPLVESPTGLEVQEASSDTGWILTGDSPSFHCHWPGLFKYFDRLIVGENQSRFLKKKKAKNFR
jgi:hypothetical protein